MGSEYDPLFAGAGGETADDLDVVRERFARASRPFLRSPWTCGRQPWLAWAVRRARRARGEAQRY